MRPLQFAPSGCTGVVLRLGMAVNFENPLALPAAARRRLTGGLPSLLLGGVKSPACSLISSLEG